VGVPPVHVEGKKFSVTLPDVTVAERFVGDPAIPIGVKTTGAEAVEVPRTLVAVIEKLTGVPGRRFMMTHHIWVPGTVQLWPNPSVTV
jgi:hypothetical protein